MGCFCHGVSGLAATVEKVWNRQTCRQVHMLCRENGDGLVCNEGAANWLTAFREKTGGEKVVDSDTRSCLNCPALRGQRSFCGNLY